MHHAVTEEETDGYILALNPRHQEEPIIYSPAMNRILSNNPKRFTVNQDGDVPRRLLWALTSKNEFFVPICG